MLATVVRQYWKAPYWARLLGQLCIAEAAISAILWAFGITGNNTLSYDVAIISTVALTIAISGMAENRHRSSRSAVIR
jgi:hypothetical protein